MGAGRQSQFVSRSTPCSDVHEDAGAARRCAALHCSALQCIALRAAALIAAALIARPRPKQERRVRERDSRSVVVSGSVESCRVVVE